MFNDKARLWYLGAAVASLLVLVAGWFLLVAPQHDSADALNTQADSLESANISTQSQINALKAQYKDLPELEQQLASIRQRMPATANMPSLIRSLSSAGSKAGVTLKEFTPSNPAPLNVDPAQAALPQGSPVAAPGQVNGYAIELKYQGRFANVRLFLNNLENLQRSFLVTSVDIKRPDPDPTIPPGTLDVVIQGRVFSVNPGQAASTTTGTSTTAGTTTTTPTAG